MSFIDSVYSGLEAPHLLEVIEAALVHLKLGLLEDWGHHDCDIHMSSIAKPISREARDFY